jgi:hypothetical protein
MVNFSWNWKWLALKKQTRNRKIRMIPTIGKTEVILSGIGMCPDLECPVF